MEEQSLWRAAVCTGTHRLPWSSLPSRSPAPRMEPPTGPERQGVLLNQAVYTAQLGKGSE